MSAVSQSTSFTDYKVADLSLADWGRKEIAIAETESDGKFALAQIAPRGEHLPMLHHVARFDCHFRANRAAVGALAIAF